METLNLEQEIRLYEAMPDLHMLRLLWAKNTAIWMETPGPEQAFHLSEVMPEPRMLPFLWAKNTVF